MLKVMLSSTTIDLPQHRAAAREAILEQKMFPLMMERMPAAGSSAWDESIKMVQECDIYVLVIGLRYGTLHDNGNSITEEEYDFAVRSTTKKRLVYIAARDHPFFLEDYEDDPNRLTKLKRFKEK